MCNWTLNKKHVNYYYRILVKKVLVDLYSRDENIKLPIE